MLMLSDSHTQNIYAIPSGKYVIQTEPSSDVEIVTYIGMGIFRRHPFGIDLGNLDYESQYFQIDLFDQDGIPEIYIYPLDFVLKSKSVKDLLDKETYSKDVESYLLFMNAIKNEFNELAKIPARWIENQKSDAIYDEKGFEQLLDYQFELSKLQFSELELSELKFSKEDKELYIFDTCRKLSQFQFQYMS